jgi:hypothetical protein
MMKYVIWGTGVRGKEAFHFLGNERVVAFIDNNPKMQNTFLFDKPVISYDKYKENYSEYFIVVSMMHYKDVVSQLEADGEYRYFILSEDPCECCGFGDSNLLEHLPFKVDNELPSVIYGINLFSIILLEKFVEMGIQNVSLVPHDDMSMERRNAIKAALPDVYQDTMDAAEKSRIYVTVESGRRLYGNAENEIYDAHDFSHQIPGYYVPEMLKYKNSHNGERCFIVATGPSLRMADLDKLYENGIYSISMNKIYHAFDRTTWRPDSYMAEDMQVIEQNWADINNLKIKNMFVADRNILHCTYKMRKGIIRYNIHQEDVYTVARGKCKFSETLEWGTYGAGTVTYSCIQLAAYMGFKEIYLLGTDFTYGNMGAAGNHFYEQEDKKNNNFDRDACLAAYETAKRYADEHDIKIYNATRGGALEVFPRVDFDTLFD